MSVSGVGWWALSGSEENTANITLNFDLVSSSKTLIKGIVHPQGDGGTQLTDVKLLIFWDVNF